MVANSKYRRETVFRKLACVLVVVLIPPLVTDAAQNVNDSRGTRPSTAGSGRLVKCVPDREQLASGEPLSLEIVCDSAERALLKLAIDDRPALALRHIGPVISSTSGITVLIWGELVSESGAGPNAAQVVRSRVRPFLGAPGVHTLRLFSGSELVASISIVVSSASISPSCYQCVYPSIVDGSNATDTTRTLRWYFVLSESASERKERSLSLLDAVCADLDKIADCSGWNELARVIIARLHMERRALADAKSRIPQSGAYRSDSPEIVALNKLTDEALAHKSDSAFCNALTDELRAYARRMGEWRDRRVKTK